MIPDRSQDRFNCVVDPPMVTCQKAVDHVKSLPERLAGFPLGLACQGLLMLPAAYLLAARSYLLSILLIHESGKQGYVAGAAVLGGDLSPTAYRLEIVEATATKCQSHDLYYAPGGKSIAPLSIA